MRQDKFRNATSAMALGLQTEGTGDPFPELTWKPRQAPTVLISAGVGEGHV